ncbi:MAG: hypothetical protein A2251_08735 [Elusimicrobia bacterium RIFOXYA2_FULL_47_53]|nr:MAG: hypothetical protein A2251_08735 [Elusimicrobia bacterium RIFOXYA2_FULL_47_53]OGS31060.1 MAG: hypothetical protein A2323_07055 [Elusimicrobia bacterium RIFOXYB2_FULL_46_23]
MYQTSGTSASRKYTGQIFDSGTGLYYYNARYYDPQLGTFITPDTIVQDLYDPQNLNRYSYCRNNPIIYTDPSGHEFWDDLGKGIATYLTGPLGLVANAATSNFSSGWDGKKAGDAYSTQLLYAGIAAASLTGAYLGSVVSEAMGMGGSGFFATVGSGGIEGAFASGAGYSGMTAMTGQSWNGDEFFQTMGRGFVMGAAIASAGYGYEKIVGYKAQASSGDGIAFKGSNGKPIPGSNNVGFQGWEKYDSAGNIINTSGFLDEGGQLSNFTNGIPGVNATAGLHDTLQIQFNPGFFRTFVANPIGVPIAVGITYPALMAGNMSGSIVSSYFANNGYNGVKK